MPTMASSSELERRLDGRLIRPADPNYDDARSIWNAMIDRRPALVVRCAGVGDVVAAVNFARDQGLEVAVRGGGHNVAGTAVTDGGVMIDLSVMNAVEVDPKSRTARVEGGALLADLDRATQAFGLATPGGVVSTTGVGGLTLGGGFGWLARKHGLTIDNLLAAEVVTASGAVLTASAHEHPDLFWGLRGGAGNFGVVTSFVFQLHEVGPEVLFGPTVYRLEDAHEVLAHYREFALAAPPACCVWADLLTAPPLPFLPEQYHGTKALLLMQCFAGDLREGERVLAPLRGFGHAIGDAVAPTPYVEAQSRLDAVYPKGARNYWKTHNFSDLTGPVIGGLIEMAAGLPTPQSDILISQVGGAINDVAPEATAYPHRDAEFVLCPGARWTDPADDARCVAWVRDGMDRLAAHSCGGAYVNFITEADGGQRAAFGSNYDRLVELKTGYDPDNLFRHNQNVRPRG